MQKRCLNKIFYYCHFGILDAYKRQSIKYIFKENCTYSYILKRRTVSGTYVFDEEAKTIIMKLGRTLI